MLKWIFRLFLFLVIVVIDGVFGIKIYLEKYFDRDIIVKQVEAHTNSRFGLDDVKIGLFSFTPSLVLDHVKIGPRDRYANEKIHIDSRTEMKSEIVSIDKIELRIDLIPLLNKKFELDRFLIHRPVVRLELGEDGSNNLSPLLSASIPESEILEGIEHSGEEFDPQTEPETFSVEEFSVSGIPVGTVMNRIGIEDGLVDILFRATGQRFNVSGLRMLLTDIDINPNDLQNHNRAKIQFDSQVSIFNKENSEQARLSLNSHANVRPFDPATGKIEPEAVYELTISRGSFIQALVALEKARSTLDMLTKIGLELDILSKKAVLSKDASTAIKYNRGRVSFEKDLKAETNDYDLEISKDSWFNVLDNTHSFKGSFTASRAETDKLLAEADKYIEKALREVRNVNIDRVRLREELLSELVKEGRLFIAFSSSGNITDPNVKVSAKMPDLTRIIASHARAAAEARAREEIDKVVEKAEEKISELKEQAGEKIEEIKSEVEDKVRDQVDDLLDEHKDRIRIPGNIGF